LLLKLKQTRLDYEYQSQYPETPTVTNFFFSFTPSKKIRQTTQSL
jgi:hypothetical protein